MMGNSDSRSLDNRYDSRGTGLEFQRKPSVPVPRLPMPDGVELERRFTKVLVSKIDNIRKPPISFKVYQCLIFMI